MGLGEVIRVRFGLEGEARLMGLVALSKGETRALSCLPCEDTEWTLTSHKLGGDLSSGTELTLILDFSSLQACEKSYLQATQSVVFYYGNPSR